MPAYGLTTSAVRRACLEERLRVACELADVLQAPGPGQLGLRGTHASDVGGVRRLSPTSSQAAARRTRLGTGHHGPARNGCPSLRASSRSGIRADSAKSRGPQRRRAPERRPARRAAEAFWPQDDRLRARMAGMRAHRDGASWSGTDKGAVRIEGSRGPASSCEIATSAGV